MKREKILILIVLAIGIGLIAFSFVQRRALHTQPDAVRLRVTSTGGGHKRTVAVEPLAEGRHQLIEVDGPLGVTIVEVDGFRAHVVSSPCPDKICVRMGWLSRPGDYAACLPNKVLAEIIDDSR